MTDDDDDNDDDKYQLLHVSVSENHTEGLY